MKTYKIPCVWKMFTVMKIEAESLEDAIDKAKHSPIPDDGYNVNNSLEVENEILGYYTRLEKLGFTAFGEM